MSSIFGIFSRRGYQDVQHTLNIQKDCLNYWSADAVGIWTNNQIGLGHLMLFNTSDSLNDIQPYQHSESKLVITSDSRLDNREEIYSKLSITTSNSDLFSDSQLILQLYLKYSEKCLDHIIGDFAFAIYDQYNNTLFCARDHLGVKPFYYFISEDYFIFSSEILGLLPLSLIKKEIRENYLCEVLYADFPFSLNETCYKYIYRLEPSNAYIIKPDLEFKFKYWDLVHRNDIFYKQEQDYIDHSVDLLQKSVNTRCRRVYSIGSELSGGIDSSTITILAHKESIKNQINFSTYSNTLKDNLLGKVYPYFDEREYVLDVCNAYNISYSFIDWSEFDFYFLIDKQIEIGGGLIDIGSSRNAFVHSQKANKNGVRVLLSGFTGDELVSYQGSLRLKELLQKGDLFNFYKEYSLWLEKKNTNIYKNIFLYVINEYFPNLIKFYKKYVKQLDYDLFKFFNDKNYYVKSLRKNYKNIYNNNSCADCQLSMINGPHVPFRFEGENIGSTSFKIEYRYPLADIRLLDFYLNIPSSLKFNNGIPRYLFRKSINNIVPDKIIYKSSYLFPTSVPGFYPIVVKNHNKIKEYINNLNSFKHLLNIDEIKKNIKSLPDNPENFVVNYFLSLSKLKI